MYQEAQKQYGALGVDTEQALNALSKIPLSMHCWQGDDVGGFDQKGPLSGGIQATGNYPGKATNPRELMEDVEKAFSLIPGKHRLNLHASYGIFPEGQWVDRDKLTPEHFAPWVEFAKRNGLGLDFNPTLFSHPKAEEFTLSSPDETVRRFWIEHCKRCLEIAGYFARELHTFSLVNIWIPDGYKDIPADRMGPRARFKASLDEILAMDYDRENVLVSLESKVFGIGLESYTVGSSEFCLGYAKEKGILPLMDNGHYHPTEVVSDKLSSLLLFYPQVALHITRPVRWDSDHVVRFDDETRELAKEIVLAGDPERVKLGLDFFDASINRIAAWAMGMRNTQKALLAALLTPHERLRELQNQGRRTELMAIQEELKTAPLGEVWEEFCRRSKVPGGLEWLSEVLDYEKEVLSRRG